MTLHKNPITWASLVAVVGLGGTLLTVGRWVERQDMRLDAVASRIESAERRTTVCMYWLDYNGLRKLPPVPPPE